MKKEKILEGYANIGINSAHALYSFVCDNDSVKLFDKKYNLSCSNEVMEFMALFLKAMDFDVKRLFFSKKKKGNSSVNKSNCHFFVVFSDGPKWFYYECLLDGLVGMYEFNDYDSLTKAVFSGLFKYFDCFKFSGSVTLREIKALDSFVISENIKSGLEGMEIVVSNDSSIDLDSFLENDGSDIKIAKRKNKGNGSLQLFVGFFGTLIIVFLLFWFVFTYVFKG